MLYSPSVSSFSFLGVTIHYYGIIIASAICICIFILDLICKKVKTELSVDIFYDLFPLLIIISILGARLYYVLLNFGYYFQHPKEIFMIWQGGLSIHGAIIFGLLTLILFIKHRKIDPFPYLDALACVFPLGQAIGRWGNFFNQEAFGTPCNHFGCLYIAPDSRPQEYIQNDFFHPAFLYESILDFVIFVILMFLLVRLKNIKPGILSGLYLVLYSVARIIVEPFRTDAAAYIFSIPVPIFVSFIFLVSGIIFIAFIHKNNE